MIIVCGTKRSGTSMWMQILKAAGMPIIGQPFFSGWSRFKEANPGGFYESPYRRGIPGVLRAPLGTCVKIFPPGLVRTHIRNIEGVIFTVRSVQEFASSRQRFWDIESKHPAHPSIKPPARTNPATEWWVHNLTWLRDLQERRYEARIVAYDTVLEDPTSTLQRTLPWLVTDNKLEAAVAAVKQEYRTQKAVDPDFDPEVDGFPLKLATLFYDSIRAGTLTPSLISDLLAADDAFRVLHPIRV